jgi:hypothetical protein
MEILIRFEKEMIAPCGINCGTCLAWLREKKNRCHGCRHADLNIPATRMKCGIKNCENLRKTDSGLCVDCDVFPCARLKHIDKRYRTRYKTSLILNLLTIKEIGLTDYLRNEIKRWSCPGCGSVLSVHRESCLKCKFELKREALV